MYTDFIKWLKSLQTKTLETIDAKEGFVIGNNKEEFEPEISFSIRNNSIVFKYYPETRAEGAASTICSFKFEDFKTMDTEEIFYSGFNNFL